MKSYLFILCPPYSGSTVLWKLISTSSAVSSLPLEGQFLPEVKDIMRQEPWNPGVKLPWENIKNVWDGYWDQEKPLLVEKSPPHIIRTKEIINYFSPVYFIIMLRNPYAHCEGLIRRGKWRPVESAEFTVRCMRQQMENAEKLDGTLCFTYEELVGNPKSIADKIQSFLPQIGELKHDQKFKVHSIHGTVEREIVDLNKVKIRNLSVWDIKEINGVLNKNDDVMNYWGYEYYEPSLRHALTFYKTRISLQLSSTPYKISRASIRVIKRLTKPFSGRAKDARP